MKCDICGQAKMVLPHITHGKSQLLNVYSLDVACSECLNAFESHALQNKNISLRAYTAKLTLEREKKNNNSNIEELVDDVIEADKAAFNFVSNWVEERKQQFIQKAEE